MIQEAWRYYPHTYARKMSGQRYIVYPHIKFISKQITRSIYEGGGRWIITLPPRHGKSEFFSKWLPGWFLDQFPNKNVILTSYGDSLSAGFGRWVRNHFDSNENTIAKLKADNQSVSDFATTTGGAMFTAGVGGPITGKGAHLLIADDLYKNYEQAKSSTYRQTLKDWFNTTFYSRQEPGATIIVLMTRWREDDLIGHLLNDHEDDWQLINLPAIAEENDMMGREKGQPLCPERYDLEALLGLKNGLPEQYWNAMYQQRPSKQEGELFQRTWWQYYDNPPHILEKIQFWDTANKPGITNDYSVCATWGRAQNGYYLLDLFRDKLAAPDLEQAMLQQYNKHRPSAVQIEDKASGTAMIQYMRQKTTIPVIAYEPGQKDKETRAINATPLAKSLKLHLPRQASWLNDFIEEHSQFPNGENDDQVDTTSQMAEYFQRPVTSQPRIRRL